jgi:hypothetical protein
MEKTTNNALYAYFGELGIFTDNIPGHSFYQLGLMDSLAKKHGINKFDFLNYIDDTGNTEEVLDIYARPNYPSGSLGEVFEFYTDKLIDIYRISFGIALSRINQGHYSKLFLKARFRNLSTLEKKLKDAAKFEMIIETALEVGFDPGDIVIVDTDLSLSKEFIDFLEEKGITREIPSITVAGISQEFANFCLATHSEVPTDLPKRELNNIMYYGNLSFDNYKDGHSKNPIALEIIDNISSTETIDGRSFRGVIAAKPTPELNGIIDCYLRLELIPRADRGKIWQFLLSCGVSLNVSKDLYLEKGFIPARVYESIIFGIIPVSYKWGYSPMSFETPHQFFEICKFIIDCSREDYLKILTRIANSLTEVPGQDK